MQTPTRCILIASVLSFFFFSGCSNTSVTSLWKKHDYTAQPFTSIMVVALTGDPGGKFLWEGKMATRLRQHGIKTVLTTFVAFPNAEEIDENDIINYVNDKGIEAVLVTRLVDTQKETVYYPPSGRYYGGSHAYYRNFNSYYSHAYSRTRGYKGINTVVLLETNLYQVKGQELVWSMSSDTIESSHVSSVRQIVDSASKKVLSTLKKDKLI
jgi:hypothetical protein